MRVLGIDLGLKRTGLALSDENGIAVRILPNLQANSQSQALEKIISLINEFSINVLVIGRPEPKTTGSIAIAMRANGFKKKLDEIVTNAGLEVKIYLWDEAMTSKKALQRLVEAQVPQKKRKALLDGASAAVLVEDFLATKSPS